jgi:NAD(P)-dependent dehydrogenase (short-subunit alcohol dehydrogenase family)
MNGNQRSPEPADGRLALVTGGDRGAGPQIVRVLAGWGMRVVSASREVQRARLRIDALGELADRVAVRELDSSDPTSVARLVSWLKDRLGRCDVLVNMDAVSVSDGRGAANVTPDLAVRAVEAYLVSAWWLNRAVIPLMRANRYGRIVNVYPPSVGLSQSSPRGLPAYEIVAAGLSALTGQLAAEVAADGILVNAYAVTQPRAATRPAGARARPHPAALVRTVAWLATLPDDGPTGVVHSENRPGTHSGLQ